MKRSAVLALLFAGLAQQATANSATPFWTAICRDARDANYTQNIGGMGTLNQGLGDGSYQSVAVKQTSYDGKTVCAAAQGAAAFAQVCADNERQIIYFKLRDQKHPKAPLQDAFYCRALVKIH